MFFSASLRACIPQCPQEIIICHSCVERCIGFRPSDTSAVLHLTDSHMRSLSLHKYAIRVLHVTAVLILMECNEHFLQIRKQIQIALQFIKIKKLMHSHSLQNLSLSRFLFKSYCSTHLQPSLFLEKLVGEIHICCSLKTGTKTTSWKFQA